MSEQAEAEHRFVIDGYELALGAFLNAPIRRAEFVERFDYLIEEARKQNGHAATIEVLRSVRDRIAAS